MRLETHARILLNSMRTLSWMSFDVCFKRPRKQARTPRNSQVRSHSHSHVTGRGQYRYRTHRGKRVSEMKGVSIRTSTSFSWSMNMGIKFGSYSFWARMRPVITGLLEAISSGSFLAGPGLEMMPTASCYTALKQMICLSPSDTRPWRHMFLCARPYKAPSTPATA